LRSTHVYSNDGSLFQKPLIRTTI